jgi:hypothetical protein
MILYLTRQAAGDYMLTEREPVIAEVGDTVIRDAYVAKGDSIGLRHLCARGVRAAIGQDLPRLVPKRVNFSMTLAEDTK